MENISNNIKLNIEAYKAAPSDPSEGLSSVQKTQISLKTQELRDNFIKDTKKSGLIEKFYNYSKNKTGLGLGSIKVGQKISEFENGKASEEDIKKKIVKYKDSQSNAAQSIGDLASIAVGVGGYFKWANFAKENKARSELNAFLS